MYMQCDVNQVPPPKFILRTQVALLCMQSKAALAHFYSMMGSGVHLTINYRRNCQGGGEYCFFWKGMCVAAARTVAQGFVGKGVLVAQVM